MTERIPFLTRLERRLEAIEECMIELLQASEIKHFHNDPDSSIVILCAPYYWGATDDRQAALLKSIKNLYDPWIEQVRVLFSRATEQARAEMEAFHELVSNWVDMRDRDHSVPRTTEEAKIIFKERITRFRQLLHQQGDSENDEVIVLPDTNALIVEPELANYGETAGKDKFTVVLVPTVLRELDKHKTSHHNSEFREKAAGVIRRIKGWRTQGDLLTGVTVDKTITVKCVATEPDFSQSLGWLEPSNADDQILASALEIQRQVPSACVVLVTSDINLQNKADMASLPYAETPQKP